MVLNKVWKQQINYTVAAYTSTIESFFNLLNFIAIFVHFGCVVDPVVFTQKTET